MNPGNGFSPVNNVRPSGELTKLRKSTNSVIKFTQVRFMSAFDFFRWITGDYLVGC